MLKQEPFRLKPFVKPEFGPYRVIPEFANVTITMTKPRFDKLRGMGRKHGLSMRQVVTQMTLYAERHFEDE